MPRNPTTEILVRKVGAVCVSTSSCALADDFRQRIEHGVLDAGIKVWIVLEHLQDDVVDGLLCLHGTDCCRLFGCPHPSIEQRGDDAVGHTRDCDSCRWPSLQSASQRESRGSCANVGCCWIARGVRGGGVVGSARADQFDFIMQLVDMG